MTAANWRLVCKAVTRSSSCEQEQRQEIRKKKKLRLVKFNLLDFILFLIINIQTEMYILCYQTAP